MSDSNHNEAWIEVPLGVKRNVSRMPAWIRQPLGSGAHFGSTASAVSDHGLNTVCVEARCPNRGECWSVGTATFMLLGDTCTRACGFCSVRTGRPAAIDRDEPGRIARAVASLGLRYVVLTSVNRDDQVDGGASIFADCLARLRQQDDAIGIEFLTPDFRSCQSEAIEFVASRLADSVYTGNQWPRLVWGHNLETVERLYRTAKKGGKYSRSLSLLEKAAQIGGVETKSALMLGLGESEEEVKVALRDLWVAGVSRVALGQYLRPSFEQLPVASYIPPEQFDEYAAYARALGFSWVKAGPLVRSSYHAEEVQGEHETQER